MNKENKSKLKDLLGKVANEQDIEIYDLNIQTNQNPIVIQIIIKKANGCLLYTSDAADIPGV